MRLDIRYVTRFVYSVPVTDSHNVLRARPADTPTQTVVSYEVAVDPPSHIDSWIDGWGTHVDSFSVHPPHRELLVTARSVVDTSEPPVPARPVPVGAIEERGFIEQHWRFLQPTRHTRWTRPIEQVARAAEGPDVQTIVRTISDVVHSRISYRPGATTIGIDVADVWSRRAGVCQDFAHLTLALLRSRGVPCRYVSGYFYAADPALGTGPTGPITVQTHAWIEVALPDFGWWGLDPTNALTAGERHVKIGHGRDYDDVLPFRGVFYGPASHALTVDVTMTEGTLPNLVLPSVGPGAAEQ